MFKNLFPLDCGRNLVMALDIDEELQAMTFGKPVDGARSVFPCTAR
jgi:hypothetical protein